MQIEAMILVGILIGLWVLILVLRVPAFAAFFSVLVGQLLSSEASSDAYGFIAGLAGIDQLEYVQVALLTLPFVLTLIFLKGRAPKSRLAVEFLPALFVASALLILAYPLIPGLRTLVEIGTNGEIARYQTIIIISAAISGLVSAWLSFPKAHGSKKSKKH